MKIALAVVLVVALILGWTAFSLNASLQRQAEQVQTLTTALADKSRKEAWTQQTECSAMADKFLAGIGWKSDSGSYHESHFNSKLNKCFVLVSESLPKDDFRSFDLYDAVGGGHFAMYIGHDVCDVAFLKDPKHCEMDSGTIWSDGNDRGNPDFRFGFRGIFNGGGAGDEKTQKAFLDKVKQAFMSQ